MALDVDAAKYTDAQCIAYYEHVLTFSDSTLEKNLEELGYVDLSSPATINLYAATFADKDRMERAIADYNESVNDLEEITYTDYVGLMMRSVTTIINAITWVLIAFVAISNCFIHHDWRHYAHFGAGAHPEIGASCVR